MLQSINETDLIAPSDYQKYALGVEFSRDMYYSVNGVNVSGNAKWVYLKAHANLTAFVPIAYTTGGSMNEWQTTSIDVNDAPGLRITVPQITVTIGQFFWGMVMGNGKIMMKAATYTSGDHVELDSGLASFVSSGTTETNSSLAVVMESGTTAVARNAYLYCEKATASSSFVIPAGTGKWRLRGDNNVLYREYSTDNFSTVAYTAADVAE